MIFHVHIKMTNDQLLSLIVGIDARKAQRYAMPINIHVCITTIVQTDKLKCLLFASLLHLSYLLPNFQLIVCHFVTPSPPAPNL